MHTILAGQLGDGTFGGFDASIDPIVQSGLGLVDRLGGCQAALAQHFGDGGGRMLTSRPGH